MWLSIERVNKLKLLTNSRVGIAYHLIYVKYVAFDREPPQIKTHYY